MGIWSHRYRRTTLLLWLCVAVLVGLAVGYWRLQLSPHTAWLIVAILMVVCGRMKWLSVVGVIIVGLAIGGARGSEVQQRLDGYDALYDQKVTLQITAHEDAVYNDKRQFTFIAVDVIDVQTGQKLPGKLGVSGFGPSAIYQDDVLLVHGKLRDGIGAYQGFMSFAELEVMSRNPSWLTELRRNFGAGMLSSLPEPMASFAMGLLIGQRATLPEEVKDNLQHVSLTHIIAVSGANLTIMLEASRKILGKRSKRLSTVLTLSLMMLFVLMTGGSASIIRAAYVSTLSVAAAYYGRRWRPLLLISLVAAFTAYIDPIYLWGDASWYLSFLAFIGVMMVSPILQNRLPRLFQTNILLAVALESICAEIMAVPYILYVFGETSLVGLVANVLVVSLIPLAMLTGLIAGLAGMLWLPFSGWFAWPAKFVLMYMLDTAHVLANLPNVFKENIWLTLPGLVLVYSGIAVMVGLLGYKDRVKSAIITDEEAINPYRNLGRMS